MTSSHGHDVTEGILRLRASSYSLKSIFLRPDFCSNLECVELLWICWLQIDHTTPWGFTAKQLPRIQFIPHVDIEHSFAFVNPSDVLCGVHLISAFAFGQINKLLGPSLVRVHDNCSEDSDTDFHYYYVNMFVNRDMFMRFFGSRISQQGGTSRVQTAFNTEDFEWVDLDEDDDEASENAMADSSELGEQLGSNVMAQQDITVREDEKLMATREADSVDEEERAGSEDDKWDEEALDGGGGGTEDGNEGAEDEYGAEGYAAW
ncbi:hypothetical protein BV20DRAFT_1058175 [Pilatotrama ljubarskyi]|nr:hypothetical protein BV20DRAFT_1058175 [Pilatotrama ljubarskyi]